MLKLEAVIKLCLMHAQAGHTMLNAIKEEDIVQLELLVITAVHQDNNNAMSTQRHHFHWTWNI